MKQIIIIGFSVMLGAFIFFQLLGDDSVRTKGRNLMEKQVIEMKNIP